MRLPALSCAVLLALTSVAAAQAPTAIVESVNGSVVGAEFMDYVRPGQVIKLGGKGSIVLAYLSNCRRETITGGVVIVGTDESRVSLGDISRETARCDRARVQVTGNTSGGGVAFRTAKKTPTPEAQIVYSLSPVIEVQEVGQLVIERIDQPGERYDAKLSKETLIKTKFHDLAAARAQLKPGGVYAATLGSRRAVFRIDQLAGPAGPLLGRLVKL